MLFDSTQFLNHNQLFYSAMLYGIQCIYLKINFLLNWSLFLFELLFILLYYYTMYTIIHEISFLISLRDYLLLITKIQLIFGHWFCIKKYTLLNLPVSWFEGFLGFSTCQIMSSEKKDNFNSFLMWTWWACLFLPLLHWLETLIHCWVEVVRV